MAWNYKRFVLIAAVLGIAQVHTAYASTVVAFPNNIGNWSVPFPANPNSTCILVKGAIQLKFLSSPGKTKTLKTIDVPSDVSVYGGTCNVTEQTLVLAWPWPSNSTVNVLIFNFTLLQNDNNDKHSSYHIGKIEYGEIDLREDGVKKTSLAPGRKGHIVEASSSGEFYPTTLNKSYRCAKNQIIPGDLTVLTSDFQYEAFRPLTDTLGKYEFDTPEVCVDDDTTYPNNIGKWSIRCEESPASNCILLNGAIQLEYVNSNKTLEKIDVPQQADTIGFCTETDEMCYIVLFWSAHEISRYYNLQFTFNFGHDENGAEYYYIEEIELEVNNIGHTHNVGEGNENAVFSVFTDGEIYPTKLNHSYLCPKEQTVVGDLTVRTSRLQFEAFRPINSKEFKFDSAVEDCKDQITTTTTKRPRKTRVKPSATTTTTTSPQPTPIPAPVEPFPKNVGNWSVNYAATNASSCILLSGALQLQYLTSPDNQDSLEVLDVPKDAIVGSTCENTTDTAQSMILAWNVRDADANSTLPHLLYGLVVNFTTNSTDDNNLYHISSAKVLIYKYDKNLDPFNLTGKDNGYSASFWTEGEFYPTLLNRSFACLSKQKITGNLTVLTENLKFEAFRPLGLKTYELDEAEICRADIAVAGAVVGIVVGTILAILLAVCVGGYLGIRYGFFRKIRGRLSTRENVSYEHLLHNQT